MKPRTDRFVTGILLRLRSLCAIAKKLPAVDDLLLAPPDRLAHRLNHRLNGGSNEFRPEAGAPGKAA